MSIETYMKRFHKITNKRIHKKLIKWKQGDSIIFILKQNNRSLIIK